MLFPGGRKIVVLLALAGCAEWKEGKKKGNGTIIDACFRAARGK